MIAILQLFFTIGMTALYAIEIMTPFAWTKLLMIIAVFLGLNVLYIIVVILIFIIIIFLTKNIDSRSIRKHNLLMMFSNYFFFSLLRVKVIAEGLENLPKDNHFVMYSNHIEYNDPFYIKKYYPNSNLAFVAKEPLYRFPILKTLLKSIGCIPIGRLADRRSLQSILKTIEQVKSGQAMGIFPEGKRSYSNDMGEFKPGAFKVATKAKADISLVAIYDFHEINRHMFRLRKVKVYLKVLPLIQYETIKDMDTVSISRMAREKIDEQLTYYKNTVKN